MLTLRPKEGIELLVVEVPGDARNFNLTDWTLYFDSASIHQLIGLSPAKRMFIATSRDITEEQAAELVEKEADYENGYKEYYEDGPFVNSSAINSFLSLLRSQRLDPDNKVYAILLSQNSKQ